jgi:rhodanese-related sulfurtransferase
MLTQKTSKAITILMLVLAVVLAACGGQAVAPVAEEAPLAAVQEVAPVEQAPVEEAVVEQPEAPAFDLVASVDSYLSAIPEGYMAIGKVDAFKEILDTGEAVVIDVREVAEYDEGHIPGAINIPLRTLAQNLDKIPADKPVITYCKSGHRASLAVSSLQMLGYNNARAFSPGYKGWTDAGEAGATDAVEAATYDVPQIEPELLAAVDGFLSNIPEGFLALGDIEKFNEAIANGAFLVDVREVAEYEEGHIPGAINVPLRTIAQNVDQIPTDQPVFVYCKSGYRAALSTAALQTMGFTNVRAFGPGWAGWTEAGQPVAAVQ